MTYSKINKITAITFEVLNEMSEYLFRHQNKKNYQEVRKKVADFLIENGEKKFIEVYNTIEETKDYIRALDIFKI